MKKSRLPSGHSDASGSEAFATAVAAAISVAIFAYVALRAATLSITHDEALTYEWHVTSDWLSIVKYSTPGLPDNNHVLYTLLCKLAVALFGVSELTLRLPSLLGCFLYLVGLNLCLRRIVPGWRQVLGIFAIGLNPYVVDYLGLARGYGLGLGFTMIGLAALLAALDEHSGRVRIKLAMLSILLFSFAALAHLSFLLVLCASLILITVPLLYAGIVDRFVPLGQTSPWIQLLKIVALVIPFLAYLTIPVRIIRNLPDRLFDIGGHTGFWWDTVGSLVTGTIHESPWIDDTVARTLVDSSRVHASPWLSDWSLLFQIWIVATLIFLPLAIWALSRTDRWKFSPLATIAAMIGIIALASWTQHALLDVALLEGRRGLFLIPLFMLMALALSNLPNSTPRWLVVAGFSVGVVVPGAIGIQGLMSTNLQYVIDWKYDAATRDAMVAVKAWIDERKPDAPIQMRVDWVFAPSGNFYRRTLKMESSLLPLNREGILGSANLYYVHAGQKDKIVQFGIHPLLYSSVANTMLFYCEK